MNETANLIKLIRNFHEHHEIQNYEEHELILKEIAKIESYIYCLRDDIRNLERNLNEERITLKSKEEVIKMLSGMITGIVDNI